MADDLPYRVEYSKSNRAACKTCKVKIEKDVLRLAVMVQSPVFDGKVPHWYHQKCFFIKQRPKTVADIAHFDSVRWEDQEAIRQKIESLGPGGGGGGGEVKGKGKGKKGKGAAKEAGGLNDFTAEYAKSSRAKCRGCEVNIKKDEVRIGKKEYDSERARMYGPVDLWHHVDCFVKKRAELEYYEAADALPGFNTLSTDDKKTLRTKLPKIEVKRKAEDEPDCPKKKIKTEEEEQVKKQSKIMFRHRDALANTLKKKEMSCLLEHNDQYMPTGESRMMDLIVDCMAFGALEPCSVCPDGRFKYESGVGYTCRGNLTEWTRCTNVAKEPKRRPFKIPQEMKEQFPYLNQYKFKEHGPRVWLDHGPSTVQLNASQENGSVKSESVRPLEHMKFVIVGSKFSVNKKDLKDKVEALGGQVTSKVEKTTAAVITTADALGGMNAKIEAAKELNIQCVSEDFLEEVEKGGALLMIQKKNMASWGGDPQDRVHVSKSSKSSKSNFGSGSKMFAKDMPDKQKIKLKGGAAVDPDSGIDDKAHVYQTGKKIYNCVLGMVDIQRGTNSYYKMQVLEHDKKNKWWVFRSWGRIGTTIGNNKLENMEDLQDALSLFHSLYEEKTGNRFSASKEFKKLPGCWYPLDIDYGQEDDAVPKPVAKGSKSKLPKAVQELVSLIFDVDTMKSALVEFEIDVKKMPLGKLSRKQIQGAYKVLSEALALIKEKGETQAPGVDGQLLDCSNRFYTLIPHDFGMKKPPVLDDVELIKAKIAMLDNLSEIEVAYSLLKTESEDDDKAMDPIDKYYAKLNTKIDVLDKTSDEFATLKTYVKNTHASTHSNYKLEIQEVFKIERDGERKRFKPFKQLHNHKLLWHGSRLTNYAGILSQGLRIAPPEAPVTGYMFGKGVYFADMVSKSANYCCTSSTHPTGLMLLADVALGNMYERTGAEYVEKLPKGKHSTKGIGRTAPDPAAAVVGDDGVEIPLGKGVKTTKENTSLLYNEYIVYDVAQINVKYLLKMNFKYNY